MNSEGPILLIVLLQICSRQQHELQHKLLRTKHSHTFDPPLPLLGRTQEQGPAFTTRILKALKALVFTQALSTDTSEDPHQQDSLNTRADAVQDKAKRSKNPTVKFRPGHTCQLPPSSQIYKTQVQTRQLLSHFQNKYQQSSFSRMAKGYLDLLSTPSVTLKAPVFNSQFTSQP